MPFPTKASLSALALLFLTYIFQATAVNADEMVTLKFSNKPDQRLVSLLHDMKGKPYFPLMEVAKFYGAQVHFDSLTRRITLEKGDNKITLVLSQPLFMATDPDLSVPIEPAEVISGQLGIPPPSAEDVFGTLLEEEASYKSDSQAFIVGGVRDEELTHLTLGSSSLSGTTAEESMPQTSANIKPGTGLTVVPTLEPMPVGAIKTPKNPNGLQEEPPAGKTMHVRRIVIDAGHGGEDAGAPSCDHRYLEKQATLDIAEKLMHYLKEKDPGLEILLTRDGDYFITLKYRTDFANAKGADLFVSIHCNSNHRKGAHGTEIYCYATKASNKWAAKAAERENGDAKELNTSMLDQLKIERYSKYFSQKLAERVEIRIEQRMGQHFRNIQTAPFYVLGHADMPSVLIETAFISNLTEENKLMDSRWKDDMARAIGEGILDYKDIVEKNGENTQAKR